VFLGLNGVVVKSHGSASARGVAHAVDVAASLLENNLIERIASDLGELAQAALPNGAAAPQPEAGATAAADQQDRAS